MKRLPLSLRRGFTLVELLVVISIIAILAALLVPALAAAKKRAQIATAKMDIKNLELAISQYESDNNRLPAVTPRQPADLTFGLAPQPGAPFSGAVVTNSDVVATLMSVPIGINAFNAKNPRQTAYFAAAKRTERPNEPGVSTVDFQIRDPWGNPYIISLDLNYDGNTEDLFYRASSVSSQGAGNLNGLNGLVDIAPAQAGNPRFALKGPVMIWSFGPDKKIDPNSKANQGVNKDNILSWANK